MFEKKIAPISHYCLPLSYANTRHLRIFMFVYQTGIFIVLQWVQEPSIKPDSIRGKKNM